MAAPTTELWFDFPSPYSYVAAMVAEESAARAGVRLIWRPIFVGAIYLAQLGIKTSPFVLNPPRLNYLWRDVSRLCAKRGLPFRKSSVFPRNSLLAARVAMSVEGSPFEGKLIRDIFEANFAHDLEIADPEVLRPILARYVPNPDELLSNADSEANRQKLRAQTDRAMALGMFGAPTFSVGNEIFFGQDRMDDAFEWARQPWMDAGRAFPGDR